jgi:dienelactone hydrolase
MRFRMAPSAAHLHLNLDVQLVSVEVNGSPADQTAADGLPQRVRAQLPEILFGRLQPDAPENGLPALLAGAASIEDVRFADLGGDRLCIAGEIVLGTAAAAAARAILQSKSGGVPVPPSGVQEQNLQVGFGRWPVDGTLTLPSGGGPFPAVLLMRGETTLVDRDGTSLADKPMRDYAWGLAARGVAVLRYDLRRWAYLIAMNKANEPVDTQEDVLTDAVSSIRVLRGLPRIRQDRIFVLGQGEAGLLAPRVAIGAPPIAGLILISSSPRMRWEMMTVASERILADPNAKPDQKENAKQLAELGTRLKSSPVDRWTAGIGGLPVSYWRFWQGYNPGAEAAMFPGSLLLVAGSKDEPFFAPEWARWQDVLGSRPHVTRKVYSDLNSQLQAGSVPADLSRFPPARPISLTALDFLASWMRTQ